MIAVFSVSEESAARIELIVVILAPRLSRWREHNVPISNPAVIALQVNGPRRFFVAIDGASRDAMDFLICYHRLSVLNDRDVASYKFDIERLPGAGSSRLLGHGSQEAINCSHVMTGRLFDRIIFHLHLVTPAKIDAAVRVRRAIDFDVQFEVAEFFVGDDV